MYLLYVDESGRVPGVAPEYFVLAGLAVNEHDAWEFGRSVSGLVQQHFPTQSDIELHATHMWSARHDWAPLGRRQSRQVLRSLATQIANWRSQSGRGVRLFATAVHKRSFPGPDIGILAHQQLITRFDTFLTRLHREGDSHRSVIIADRSSYEGAIQGLVARWKGQPNSAGTIPSVAEVPLYVDSRASRLVQAADAVAWGVWQYYENGHDEWIGTLQESFDSAGDVQHGLAHMVRGYRECACIACASRRERRIVPVVEAPRDAKSLAEERIRCDQP